MTKFETIIKALEERIAEFNEGDKLPKEKDLCEEFSVSRMTVNKAISKLADKGLVYRRKKAGTFVSGISKQENPIYILIPCPGSLNNSYPGGPFYLQLINHLQIITLGRNIPIITVAASPSNSEIDIDEKNLEIIRPGGTVVVMSTWFRRAFSWLSRHNCNVIYINNQVADDIFDFERYWNVITLNNIKVVSDAAKRFRQAGRERPLAIVPCYNQTVSKIPHPVETGWKKGIEKYYGASKYDSSSLYYYPYKESPEAFGRKLDKYLKNNKHDSFYFFSNHLFDNYKDVFDRHGLLNSNKYKILINCFTDNQCSMEYPHFYFSVADIAKNIYEEFVSPKKQSITLNAEFEAAKENQPSNVFYDIELVL